MQRGYYHKYTVETPGAHDCGACRIITGGNPPVVYYALLTVPGDAFPGRGAQGAH